MATLTVVIATWNRVELTENCLASLFETTVPLEVVVVDNGSTDGTVAMIESRFPQVRLIRNAENLGVTKAWHQGFAAATSPLVCVANNDLLFEPNCLERLVAPLQSADWVGVTSAETYLEPDEAVPPFKAPAQVDDSLPPDTNALRVGYTGWCFVFRRADYLQNFDLRYFLWYQDKDFLYTMMFKRRGVPPFRWPVAGKVPVVVAGARVSHQYHGSHGQLNRDWVIKQTDSEKRMFNRKWQGVKGNRSFRDIEWGKVVYWQPSEWTLVAEQSARTQSTEPLVSVIIPCFNRAKLLTDTLETVVKQTHPALELILVDDNSAESLDAAVSDALVDFDGRWRLVRMARNVGPGAARGVGATLATGDYIQYLDSDDLPHPEKIARQVAHLEQQPDLVMSYATTHYAQSGSILGRSNQSIDKILPDVLTRSVWTTSSCLWRRDGVPHADAWHPLYAAEDLLFDFHVGLLDRPIGLTPSDEPLMYKRENEESLSASAHGIAYQLEVLKALDLMWDAARQSAQPDRWRPLLADRFAGRIMTFLKYRRPWEVQHCIDQTIAIDPAALGADARLAALLNQRFETRIGFVALRKWRWLVKMIRMRVRRG